MMRDFRQALDAENEEFRTQARVNPPYLKNRNKFVIKLGMPIPTRPTIKFLRAIGAGIVGAALAGNPLTAKIFFPQRGLKSGIAELLGFPTASTPPKWVLFVALLFAFSYVVGSAIHNFFKRQIVKIPKNLIGSEDALVLSFARYLATISMQLTSEGSFNPNSVGSIRTYLVDDWGYSEEFVRLLVEYTSCTLSSRDYRIVGQEFVRFLQQDKNCNHRDILRDIERFLRNKLSMDDHLLRNCFGR